MPGARGSGGHSRSARPKRQKTGLNDAILDLRAPEDLSAKAIAYWDYYARVLRLRQLWTESTRDILRSYCLALVLRDRLEAELEGMPLAFIVPKTSPDGNQQDDIKANPLINQVRAIRLECRQHANDLCLSPASAVRMPQPDEDEEPKAQTHDFYAGAKPLPRPRSKGEKPSLHAEH